MASDKTTSELRGDVPRSIVDVLDAVSHARRKSRFELVVEILEAWRDQQMREVIAVTRVTMNGEERR